MPEIGYWGAMVAGLLSFLSPCVLPMLPFYLSYLAGISIAELRGEDRIAPGVQRRLVLSAIAFALGVTTIFLLFGLGATALGQVFAEWRRPLSFLAAGVLLIFGLHFLGLLHLSILTRSARWNGAMRPAGMSGGYLMGLAFGFGWTPCVGPALTAILLVASAADSLWQGAGLLLIYGLAMTLPFVLAAIFVRPALAWAARRRRHLRHAERLMGLMLILFALLIATGSVNRIADWLILNFDWSATLI